MFYEGCTIEEVKTYRQLENEVFNFGEDNMKMEGWYGSEDTYYKMDIQNHEAYISEKQYYKDYIVPQMELMECDIANKKRLNRYDRKKITKQKLLELDKIPYYGITWNKGEYIVKMYLGRGMITSFYKRVSNKKVRRFKGNIPKGNWYRRLFDYQYTIW